MNKGLLILGAGQYGNVVCELAREMGSFDKIDFLDDSSGKAIGKIDDLEKYFGEYSHAIPAIGNPAKRLELISRIEKTSFQIPTIVSPRAYVSASAQLYKGTVIEPLAGVHANAVVGTASYISMGAVVNHDARVGEGCHVDNNAVVMSGARVADGTKVAPCSVVKRAEQNTLEYNFEMGM